MSLSKPNSRPSSIGQPPRVDFLPNTKYTNTLPDPPYDGKFLKCSKKSLQERFAGYHATQLEASQRRPNMCDMDAGVNIDMVDPTTYRVEQENILELDEKDAMLLEDESKESMLKSKRSAQHANIVPFMRRTEYISAEFNRMGTGADRQETKVGYNLFKRGNADEIFYRDRESQIAAIDKTFEDVRKPVTKHHSKPGVTAVEECFLFPDFELWKYPFAQVLFDADPSFAGVTAEMQKMCLENSVITATDEAFIGMFCPPPETMQEIMEEDDEAECTYNYDLNREYTWVVRNKTTVQNYDDDYVLHKKGDNFYYNELSTNVRLLRKRIPAGERKRNFNLQATMRDPNEAELAQFEQRNKELFNIYDKEDETEEAGEQEEAEEKAVKGEAMEVEEAKDSDNESSSSASSKSSKASSSSSSSSDAE